MVQSTPESEAIQRLVPYAFGTDWNLERLNLDLDLERSVEILDFADNNNEQFAELWLRSNQLAFGGIEDMGMPRWVFVDCAIMAFSAIGFMLEADDVPEQIRQTLQIPETYRGWVPVSEYSVCPTVEDRTVAGFSLHSRLEGAGIGTRTKALGLLAAGAAFQTGVTQYTSPALRVHTRFGPLEVLINRPPVHDHSPESLAYRLHVPSSRDLAEMAKGQKKSVEYRNPEGKSWDFRPLQPEAHEHLDRHLDRGRAFVVAPGFRSVDGEPVIPMILSD